MARNLFGQLNKFIRDAKEMATEAVSKQEVMLVRGKVAGTSVHNDFGEPIIQPGERVTDEIIARAEADGKLHALVRSVTTAHYQDLKEVAQSHFDNTEDGQERKALNSSEEYAEARRYTGRVCGVDVTDVRLNVLIPVGKRISEDDIRIARDAGQLAALIYAVQQPYDGPVLQTASEPKLTHLGVQPVSANRPKPVPLVPLGGEDDEQQSK